MVIDIQILIDIAKGAGDLLLEAYEHPYEMVLKEDRSPVTTADVASQREIVSRLKYHYPNIPVVAEEEGMDVAATHENCFLVDPLDGTKEFMSRTDEFCVLIAYIQGGAVTASVVHGPVLQRTFYAVKGKGAFELRGNQGTRLHVSSKDLEATALVSRFHRDQAILDALEKEKGIDKIMMFGSALKGCLIAAGEAELYLRWGNTYKWDTAAVHLIVEEAGGMVMQLDGSPIGYDLSVLLNEKGLLISNGRFNDKTLNEACFSNHAVT